VVPVLALLLFGSGFSALIYQVIWVRLLGLVFGVTVYAASAVLAAFMGGLALGSYVAGRLSDRIRSPLRWFAAAEALIGCSALATPTLLAWLTPLYRQISAARVDDTGALTIARLACSAAILLVPTTMMGGHGPVRVAARALGTRRGGPPGRRYSTRRTPLVLLERSEVGAPGRIRTLAPNGAMT
jgi:spermidine synthase